MPELPVVSFTISKIPSIRFQQFDNFTYFESFHYDLLFDIAKIVYFLSLPTCLRKINKKGNGMNNGKESPGSIF